MAYRLLPNGKHHWNFRLGGRGGHRKKVTTSDFKAGEKEVRRLIYEFENGLAPANLKQGLSFYDICDGYYADSSIGSNVSQQKKKTITSQINCFKRDIPNYSLAYFSTPNHEAYNAVSSWMKHYLKSTNRLGGSISPQSVNRKFNTLRAIFNWAIAKGLMRDNPCKRVKKLGAVETLPRFLTQEEVNRLFDHSPRQCFINYCTIVLNTGMRPGEVLRLQIENIDLPNLVIAGFTQKNRKKLGSVPIKESFVGPLKEMIGTRTTGQLLNGYTLAMLRKDATKAIRMAKINSHTKPGICPFTIYGLRHTFASHMLIAREDMATVATWLRNGLEICYKHYGHLTQQFLVDAGNKIDLVPKMELKVLEG